MTTNIYTTYRVTAEQVAMAHRFINEQTHQVIFKVESASSDNEYTVYYDRVLRHLVCNCKAGQVGTPCWHKRAALAASAEYRQEIRNRNEAEMIKFSAEIATAPYTVQVSETSSSLDGITWEVAPSGRMVPMR